MKKITVFAFAAILILTTINFSGCTDGNDFIGSWRLIERLGEAPYPGINTTWIFYSNDTYIGMTTANGETTSIWSTYEVRDDTLYTSTIDGGVPMNYKFEFSDNKNILSFEILIW